MSEQDREQQVVIIGPDGQPVAVPASAVAPAPAGPDAEDEQSVTDLVEQPAKVMRIGGMIRQLLEEVRSAPLDEASRIRLKEIHAASIKELESGLAPELVEELERLSLPFTEDAVPVRRRAADRAGPAGRLARGALPRHPDRDLRPADGGAGPVRADPPGAAARAGPRRRRPRDARRAASAAAHAGRLGRHVPLTRGSQDCRVSRLRGAGTPTAPAPGHEDQPQDADDHQGGARGGQPLHVGGRVGDRREGGVGRGLGVRGAHRGAGAEQRLDARDVRRTRRRGAAALLAGQVAAVLLDEEDVGRRRAPGAAARTRGAGCRWRPPPARSRGRPGRSAPRRRCTSRCRRRRSARQRRR